MTSTPLVAIPAFADALKELIESSQGRLAEVTETKDYAVRVKVTGETSGSHIWYATPDKSVPVATVGILIPVRGKSWYFQALGLPQSVSEVEATEPYLFMDGVRRLKFNEQFHVTNWEGWLADISIDADAFAAKSMEGQIQRVTDLSTLDVWQPSELHIGYPELTLTSELSGDRAKIAVNTDVMARRDWVQANYTPYWDIDWLLRYGTIHPFAFSYARDPIATTTSIDPNNPHWFDSQSIAVPPGIWRLNALILYNETSAGPGMGYRKHFQFRGSNYYAEDYANPKMKTYTLHGIDFTTTDPNWEWIAVRPGFSGAWAAGTTTCSSASVFGTVRRVG